MVHQNKAVIWSTSSCAAFWPGVLCKYIEHLVAFRSKLKTFNLHIVAWILDSMIYQTWTWLVHLIIGFNCDFKHHVRVRAEMVICSHILVYVAICICRL